MKRAMLRGPGDLTVEECVKPEPGPGEVIVRVAACGICGSDLHSFKGEHPLVIYPVTPGHEFAGTVSATGEGVDPGLEGSLACVEPSLFCGQCPQCRSGRYNICDSLRVMGFQAPGAMCEYVAVPAHRLHMLPGDADLLAGALAEPAAVGVHAVARSDLKSGEKALVIGAGVIGLMVLKAALARGCEVVVVEENAERAARAAGFGAADSFVFSEVDVAALSEVGGREDFSAVFECVGKADTIDLAVRVAPRGGTVVTTGVPAGPVPVAMPLVQDGELDIRGTLMYMGEDYERALEMIAAGSIKASDFVTHTFSLDDIVKGYGVMAAAQPATLKVMIEI